MKETQQGEIHNKGNKQNIQRILKHIKIGSIISGEDLLALKQYGETYAICGVEVYTLNYFDNTGSSKKLLSVENSEYPMRNSVTTEDSFEVIKMDKELLQNHYGISIETPYERTVGVWNRETT